MENKFFMTQDENIFYAKRNKPDHDTKWLRDHSNSSRKAAKIL